jgi:death-on-curing protein
LPALLNEPTWLDADFVIELNELAVAASEPPEPHILLNRNSLESAVAKPASHWNYGERDMVVLAVTLLVGIGRNHPFIQGNKRCAFTSAEYFLHLNGHDLALPDGEDLADFCRDVIIGDVSEQRLVETLWEYVEAA